MQYLKVEAVSHPTKKSPKSAHQASTVYILIHYTQAQMINIMSLMYYVNSSAFHSFVHQKIKIQQYFQHDFSNPTKKHDNFNQI